MEWNALSKKPSLGKQIAHWSFEALTPRRRSMTESQFSNADTPPRDCGPPHLRLRPVLCLEPYTDVFTCPLGSLSFRHIANVLRFYLFLRALTTLILVFHSRFVPYDGLRQRCLSTSLPLR